MLIDKHKLYNNNSHLIISQEDIIYCVDNDNASVIRSMSVSYLQKWFSYYLLLHLGGMLALND